MSEKGTEKDRCRSNEEDNPPRRVQRDGHREAHPVLVGNLNADDVLGGVADYGDQDGDQDHANEQRRHPDLLDQELCGSDEGLRRAGHAVGRDRRERERGPGTKRVATRLAPAPPCPPDVRSRTPGKTPGKERRRRASPPPPRCSMWWGSRPFGPRWRRRWSAGRGRPQRASSRSPPRSSQRTSGCRSWSPDQEARPQHREHAADHGADDRGLHGGREAARRGEEPLPACSARPVTGSLRAPAPGDPPRPAPSPPAARSRSWR